MPEDIVADEEAAGETPAGTVKEDAAAQEAAAPAEQAQGQFAVSEEEWTALKALLDKRYTEIAALLRYNKTKDESIQRLSSEVQKYRDGFAYSALKPFVNALIAFREDCYKSLRDAEEHKDKLDDEKRKKYIDYLVSDFEEMLSNVSLERKDDGSITLNGKPLGGEASPKKLPEEPPAEEKSDEAAKPLVDVAAITNTSELTDYLHQSEEAIRLALADRTAIDKTMQAYMALAARTDAEHYFALVGPVAKKLFAFNDKIAEWAKPAGGYSGDTLEKYYVKFLEGAARGAGTVLSIAGVTMERLGDGSMFDAQKNKLMKTVPTDNEELDRIIAKTYTDCYTFDGKVVYQSKVDVYKYQEGEKNNG